MSLKLKLIIIGDSGSGKTSIINRLTYNEFIDTYEPTIGVDFKVLKKQTKLGEVRIMLWDTTGQERFNSIVSSYFRGSDGVLLCFALNDKESFENLNKWLDMIKINCQPKTSIILLGTKSDLTNKIDHKNIIAYASQNEIDYFTCSSKLDKSEQIDKIIDALISCCLKNKKIVKEGTITKLVDSESKTHKNIFSKGECCMG